MNKNNKIYKFFTRLFQKNKMPEQEIEMAAYHESGHIVLAYFTGYSCEHVSLVEQRPGDAIAKINYGDDNVLLAALVNFERDPNFFEALPNPVRSEAVSKSQFFISIFVAGSVAEYILKNKGKTGMAEIMIAGNDLDKIDNVNFYLSTNNHTHPADYVSQKILEVYAITEHHLWDFIEPLARKLLDSESKRLERREIEQSLTESGFFRYIDALSSGISK